MTKKNKARDKAFATLAAIMVVAHGYAVQAQVPPGISSAADPAQADKRLNTPPMPEPPSPQPEVTPGQLPMEAAPQGAEAIDFTLKELTIEGSTAYTDETLQKYYADFVGKTIRLSDIYAIAQAITQRYRDDGYFLSKVIVPPQSIKDGKVKIQVIEGYIADVAIQGDLPETGVIQGHIERIEAQRPIDIHTLERHLLLLNDLAGISVRGVVEPIEQNTPGFTPGAVRLVLMGEKETSSPAVTVDNYGSRFIGPYQVTGRYSIAGLTQPYHDISVVGLISVPTEEIQYGSAQYSLPIGGNGTRLEIGAGVSHASPGFHIEDQDIQGDSNHVRLAISHPFVRSRRENFTMTGELTIRDNSSDILTSLLYEDRLRIAKVSGNYDIVDDWGGANVMSMAVSQGLDILNATNDGDVNISRAGGKGDFTKLEASYARLQSISGPWSAYAAVNGQFASGPLLASEEFAIGGPSFGRGYDPSEYTGDHGLAATLEIRYDMSTPWAGVTAQPFIFYDIGKVWNRDVAADDKAVASAGIGTRLNIGDHISATVTVAQPLMGPVPNPPYGDGNAPRVLGAVTYRF
ncbi:hypothetical protein GC177_00040 [bacterium]|nr:hypothetical protein [bacterium]